MQSAQAREAAETLEIGRSWEVTQLKGLTELSEASDALRAGEGWELVQDEGVEGL